MDSLVILWQSNLEEVIGNEHIEDKMTSENSYIENNSNAQKNFQSLANNTLYKNENTKNADINNSDIYPQEEGFGNLANFNKNLISEKKLNYKNKHFPETNYQEYVDPKEHLAENLSKLFDKMVFQLEMVTK